MEQALNERHQEKVSLRQASYARKKASATQEKGLIIVHVVMTGRNANDELLECADLVTTMQPIKHPSKAGSKAQRGVEF